MISKELFIEYIDFIKKKRTQENDLSNTLEVMCPGCYCDTLIYEEYEEKLVNLLKILLNDTDDLIGYKLYEFDEFDEEMQAEQIQKTPEVESWETVYDYLVSKEK